jgi:hypothetical protein
MIKLNYDQNAVLAMFFQGGGSINPTTEQIQKFDADLFAADETVLVQQMTTSNLDPTDVGTKSKILMYSRMTGGGSMPAQIHRACVFFKNTNGL